MNRHRSALGAEASSARRSAARLPGLLLAFQGIASGLACDAALQPPQSPVEAQVQSGLTGAHVALSDVLWQPGLSEYELQVKGQGARSIAVWVPPAAAPGAVLIFLHGLVTPHPGHHRGDEYERTRAAISCLLTPALGYLHPLIVAPRSPSGQWWSRSDTEFVLGLVLAARERWPAAGARSVILGYSNGGIGSWYFARSYPEYFAAAIPMAFSAMIVGDTPLPVYAILGTQDEQFEFESVRAAVALQTARGYDVTLNQKYRGSHYAPCSYEPELASAAHWLETHVFGRNGG